jgi:hypothetical protein
VEGCYRVAELQLLLVLSGADAQTVAGTGIEWAATALDDKLIERRINWSTA